MIKNISWKQLLFWCVLLCLVMWHLWTLTYSPIPWYDEIVFASINHNIISGNGMINEVEGNFLDYTYGPVYFILTAISTKMMGFGIFSFRIVNLLFAFLSVGITYLILSKKDVPLKKLAISLLIMDVLFIQNSHSGRMECTALAFALACYYLAIKETKLSFLETILFSLFIVVSFMTTPRVAVILIPVYLYEFFVLMKAKMRKEISIILALPLLIYLFWIYSSYGSFINFISFYLEAGERNLGKESLFETFVGGNFMISFYHYPIIIFSIISVIYICIADSLKKVKLFIWPIFLFYLLVVETGNYATMILPFFVIIIGIATRVAINRKNAFVKILFMILFCVCTITNIGVFVLKSLTVTTTIKTRNPEYVDKWVSQVLKPGERITGSDAYYYSLSKNGNPFMRPINLTIDNRSKSFKNGFCPDYLLLADEDKEPWTKYILPQLNITKISELKLIKEDNFLTRLLEDRGISIRCSYGGTLYKIDGVK